ncbi:MAG: replication initiator protein [Microvirus sp.]|nr:MAG: replication initiator protein [Microvirus sp.]
MEEIRTRNDGKFITTTFSDEALIELGEEVHRIQKQNIDTLNKEHKTKTKYIPIQGYDLDNEIATLAVRRFLERYRKDNGKSIKHWLVTELGQEKTERLHIHGLIWTNQLKPYIEKVWKYGNVNKRDKNWEGNYVNEITVNYIVKYINATDEIHKYYNPVILTSPGIGSGYMKRQDSKNNKYKGEQTKEHYTTRTGHKVGLPMYYRNKIYNEDEKENLWINRLNKQERWVNGIKVDVSEGEEDYNNVLKHARQINKVLGFGEYKTDTKNKQYEIQQRNIRTWTRIQKAKIRSERENNTNTENNSNSDNNSDNGMQSNKDFDNKI